MVGVEGSTEGQCDHQLGHHLATKYLDDLCGSTGQDLEMSHHLMRPRRDLVSRQPAPARHREDDSKQHSNGNDDDQDVHQDGALLARARLVSSGRGKVERP